MFNAYLVQVWAIKKMFLMYVVMKTWINLLFIISLSQLYTIKRNYFLNNLLLKHKLSCIYAI